MNDIYLYPHSHSEAVENDELLLWRKSHQANVACKKAIEESIRAGFDGMYLQEGCVQGVLAEYGYKRVNWVLSATLQAKDYDGRFSRVNRAWAKQTDIPNEMSAQRGWDYNAEITVDSHPAVLDGFVNLYRQAQAALGLFEAGHCEPDSCEMDYEGKVLVLSKDILREECWRPQDQLWLALDGFGCGPKAIGRSIRCVCLGDAEMTRWNRRDFIGVLKDECMPDWARERLQELQPSQLSNCGEAQHSVFAAKRRSNEAERMPELARTEQSVVCDDEGGMHMT